MADTTTTSMDPSNKAELLLNTESMIKRYLGDMEKLRNDIKEQRDMVDSTFENDAVFSEKMKKEDEVKKEKEALKEQLMKTTAVLQADAKLKELKDELKDTQKSLEGLLKQYQELAGTNQIVRDDGEIFEIVTTFKIKKKSA